MKRIVLLKYLNPFLIVAFITASISLLLYRYIPSEIQGSETLYMIHSVSGLIMIILGICHFILNFNWVKNVYKKKKKQE